MSAENNKQLMNRFVEFINTASKQLAYEDRKSTRLNSSHLVISYAVFCLKKKKKRIDIDLGADLHSSRARPGHDIGAGNAEQDHRIIRMRPLFSRAFPRSSSIIAATDLLA